MRTGWIQQAASRLAVGTKRHLKISRTKNTDRRAVGHFAGVRGAVTWYRHHRTKQGHNRSHLAVGRVC